MDRVLIDYIPRALRNVTEYDAVLTRGEQAEIAALWTYALHALDNQFLSTAHVYGVERLETMFRIVPKHDETIEERKLRLLARLSEQLPFTMTTLHQSMAVLCGSFYALTLFADTYTLVAEVGLPVKEHLNAVSEMLHRIVPANLVITVILLYNRHETLEPFTHGFLERWTYEQLKSSVL